MTVVYEFDGVRPVVHASAYVHPTAVLIGDVIVGANCYVGPAACLRGDFGRLVLEEGVNFQDTCVMHSFPGQESVVEVNGHIGHGAILHGCRIGRNVLVGMNAIVMDNAVIGESSLVAAMSFVKKGMVVPARSLVSGIPAQVVRAMTEEEVFWKTEGTTEYQRLAAVSLRTLRAVDAFTEIEPGRQASPFAQESYQRLVAQRETGAAGAARPAAA